MYHKMVTVLFIFYYFCSGLSVESKGEGIVVTSVEEGRLAHVQGKDMHVHYIVC